MKTISASSVRCLSLAALALIVTIPVARAQQRPPAVPLIAHNPYFSVWSMADKLTDQDTKHWTGARQPIAGLARIDGKTYRFMGAQPRARSRHGADCARSHAHAYRLYISGRWQVTLTVTFFTPAFPKDLDVLSRPVTYLTLAATGQGEHDRLGPGRRGSRHRRQHARMKPLPGAVPARMALPFLTSARAISAS